MYAKNFDRVRRAIPFVMIICGVNLVICARLRYASGVTVFFVGVAACLVATFALTIEYLVRAWVQRPGRTLAWYQISLAGVLGLTTFVAVVCSFFKIFGPLTIVGLVVLTVLIACFVESVLYHGNNRLSNPILAGTANERKIVTLTPNAVELARKIILDRGFSPESALRIVLRDDNSLQIDVQYDLPWDDDHDWVDGSSGVIVLVAKAIAHQLEGLMIDAQDGQYVFDRQSAYT